MRHKYFSYWIRFCVICIFICSFSSYSQVGINTIDPRTTLEVAGDLKIEGSIKINEINALTDSDNPSFLTQTPDGYIRELNAREGDGLVIAYFQEYRFKNMQGDWVKKFNTNIPSSKYVLTIISTYFNKELIMDPSQSINFSIPYCSAYIAGNPGTWHIVADYPGAAPNEGVQGEWVISTLILSKEFSKILPQQNITMDGRRGAEQTDGPVID